jgi:hypothetical protein
MKRSAVTAEYEFYTGKTSEVVRNLALAGFALIWLFKRDTDAGPLVPTVFLWPAFVLLLTLTADFLHYAFGAPLWGWYDEEHNRLKTPKEQEVKPPKFIYWILRGFFYTKLVLLVTAYVWLLSVLASNRNVFVDVPSAPVVVPLAGPPPGSQ